MLPTYQDYTQHFGDFAKIPQGAFDLFLHRAVTEINAFITERVEDLTGENQTFCILEAADLLHTDAECGGIISENTDGYSVTYEKGNADVYAIVKKYLPEYIFRGVEL